MTDDDRNRQQEDLASLFRYAIPVPGLLHILSNALQDVTSSLKCWPEYKVQLNNFSALLCNRSRLDLLVATCVDTVSHPLQREARSVFGRHLPTLRKQRWGSVIAFVGGMLRLWHLLCVFWDQTAFSGHDGGLETDSVFDVALLTSSLGSPFFRAYSEMLQSLQDVVVEASVWAEGCPCHVVPHQTGKDRRSLKHADEVRQTELGSGPCPLAGRRAPELAAGRLQDIIAGLASRHICGITARFGAQLDSKQCISLAADFETGRRRLEATLVVKLDHWRQLPWMMAGLAHDDVATARRLAGQCIAAFDSVPAHLSHQHHELSKMLLTAGTSFRSELEMFAGGHVPGLDDAGSRGFSADLLEEVARLRFIPVVEREIEAKHAAVKHTLAALTRHGPARVSMGLRSMQLWEELSKSTIHAKEEFFRLLDQTRLPSTAAAGLGLHSHPLLTTHLKQVSRSQQLKVLEHATYRCDIAAQFADHDEVARRNFTEHAAERRDVSKVQSKRARPSSLINQWIGRVLPTHLQQLFTLEDVAIVFSLPGRVDDAVLPGFRSLADSLVGEVRRRPMSCMVSAS
jgi:hypothetical protein